jgi:hypothetical protein
MKIGDKVKVTLGYNEPKLTWTGIIVGTCNFHRANGNIDSGWLVQPDNQYQGFDLYAGSACGFTSCIPIMPDCLTV